MIVYLTFFQATSQAFSQNYYYRMDSPSSSTFFGFLCFFLDFSCSVIARSGATWQSLITKRVDCFVVITCNDDSMRGIASGYRLRND